MSRVVRAFLVWVMVITMPVQGLAASLMLFCGPDPSTAPPCVAHGHAHDFASDGQVHTMPGDAADAREAAYMHGHDGAPHAASATPPGAHSCSACAACCALLALPASGALPGAVPLAHPTPTSSAAVVPSLPPDGLERPPRACLG